MHYEYADFQAEQEAMAEQEAQAHYEAMQAEAEAEQYNNHMIFLEGLIKNGQYKLFALHYVQDLLASKEFNESKMSIEEFLLFKKEQLEIS